MAKPEKRQIPVDKITEALKDANIPLFRNDEEARAVLDIPEKAGTYFIPADNQILVQGGVQEQCDGCE